MVVCYHDEIEFEDPAFGILKGEKARNMWRMLCANARDLKIEYSVIESNEKILMQMAIQNLKPNKEYEFAIDYTNDPYYGKINTSNDKYVIRGQAKKSTNSFYSYISLYIINKNERFTIAVLPGEKGKSKV